MGSPEDKEQHQRLQTTRTYSRRPKPEPKSIWQIIADGIAALWQKFMALFEEHRSLEELYEDKVNQLSEHLGTYIHQATEMSPADSSEYARQMSEKHNAALSLLLAINPNAKYRGEKIKLPRDKKLYQQQSKIGKSIWNLQQKKKEEATEHKSRPVTAWVKNHAIGETYEARDLNYHRTSYGRFFQTIFGQSVVKTKTISLIEDVIELEQMRKPVL